MLERNRLWSLPARFLFAMTLKRPRGPHPGFGSFRPVSLLCGVESRKNHHKQSGASKVRGGWGRLCHDGWGLANSSGVHRE